MQRTAQEGSIKSISVAARGLMPLASWSERARSMATPGMYRCWNSCQASMRRRKRASRSDNLARCRSVAWRPRHLVSERKRHLTDDSLFHYRQPKLNVRYILLIFKFQPLRDKHTGRNLKVYLISIVLACITQCELKSDLRL